AGEVEEVPDRGLIVRQTGALEAAAGRGIRDPANGVAEEAGTARVYVSAGGREEAGRIGAGGHGPPLDRRRPALDDRGSVRFGRWHRRRPGSRRRSLWRRLWFDDSRWRGRLALVRRRQTRCPPSDLSTGGRLDLDRSGKPRDRVGITGHRSANVSLDLAFG